CLGIAHACRLVEGVGGRDRQRVEGGVIRGAGAVLHAGDAAAQVRVVARVGIRIGGRERIAEDIVRRGRADQPAGGEVVACGAAGGVFIAGGDESRREAALLASRVGLAVVAGVAAAVA